MRRYHAIIRRSGVQPERVLEVGGLMGEGSLLRFPELAGADRYCLNVRELPSEDGITAVKANANDMRDVFRSNCFDLVLCCSTLEHDKNFWRSVSEMRRVLRPGGLLIISVPGYVRNPVTDSGRSTRTYRVHYTVDYYRFSAQAVRHVFFEGMERVRVRAFMTPPRIFGHGYKPQPPSRARQARALARRTAGKARRLALRPKTRL